MMDLANNLLGNEDGATVVEYAVMLASIIAMAFAAIQTLGLKVNTLFTIGW